MNLSDARAFDDGRSVFMADASASHDGYAALGRFDQCSNRVDPFETSLLAARSEDPIRSSLANALQGAKNIRRHVKGTVERDRERFSHFYQLPRAFDVDLPFRVENAEDNSIRTQLPRGLNVSTHNFHFLVGVAEITGSWANDGKQANRYSRANRCNQPRAGGNAPFEEIAAQLDTRSAAALCRDRRCNRIDTDFDNNVFSHVPIKAPARLTQRQRISAIALSGSTFL
jgi:hypothetical protein